jgi:hypothetical protein
LLGDSGAVAGFAVAVVGSAPGIAVADLLVLVVMLAIDSSVQNIEDTEFL